MENKFINVYYKIQDKTGNKKVVITQGVMNINQNMFSFIQIYSNINKKTVFLKYKIEDFSMCANPFTILIGDNYFSDKKISLNIKTSEINTFGKIESKENIMCNHDVMGAFNKVKYMSCRTGILNIKNRLKGYMYIDKEKIDLEDGTMYVQIEKGKNYPQQYFWLESTDMFSKRNKIDKSGIVLNISKDKNVLGGCTRYFYLFMLLGGKQYVFATYNGGRIKEFKSKKIAGNEVIDIKIKQKDLLFKIRVIKTKGHYLTYPFEGKIERVKESVTTLTLLSVYEKDKKILKAKYKNCACQLKKRQIN